MIKKLTKQLAFNFTRTQKLSEAIAQDQRHKGQTFNVTEGQKGFEKNKISLENENKVKFTENISWGYANQLADTFSLFESSRGLYEIAPINKRLNKNILSMAYTPGVGAVCK